MYVLLSNAPCHTEAWMNWPPFCRRNFLTHFLVRNVFTPQPHRAPGHCHRPSDLAVGRTSPGVRTLTPIFFLGSHDDVIKWKHFPRNWPFVREIHRSPVNSPHKGQWRGALMFPLIWAWINGWVNNGEAGDLRRHRAHYDITVMIFIRIKPITLKSRTSSIMEVLPHMLIEYVNNVPVNAPGYFGIPVIILRNITIRVDANVGLKMLLRQHKLRDVRPLLAFLGLFFKYSRVCNFSRIIFKHGKDIYNMSNMFDYIGSALSNMCIMDHIMNLFIWHSWAH